ncbi:MAG: hypothetical protein Q4D82_02265 [Neisseria sp.]|nr:hypothetical protein [Neisseria sp.]
MKETLYWNQAFSDNLIETVMIVLVLAFLAYVVKLAFSDYDNEQDEQ